MINSNSELILEHIYNLTDAVGKIMDGIRGEKPKETVEFLLELCKTEKQPAGKLHKFLEQLIMAGLVDKLIENAGGVEENGGLQVHSAELLLCIGNLVSGICESATYGRRSKSSDRQRGGGQKDVQAADRDD